MVESKLTRRSFVKTVVGCAAAGFALPQLSDDNAYKPPSTQNKKLTVADVE